MKSKFHAAAGALALLCIVTFWTSTLVSELFLSTAHVITVKNGILTAMWLLIPAMAVTGISGFVLARQRKGRLIDLKQRRMRFVAANGLLILVPCAIALARLANAGQFDTIFYAIQCVELLAGAANIRLLVLNARDGMRLSGHLPRPSPARAPK
ncbi:hypothetical protein [Pusillimonas noertemannii]|uniref:Uncharacterized protein n=1 Tax=Pusillimonas noertemannii TaxID=305977 RepID=A0A2U1CM38_9BURK|nr:hypothetical protein [Pusillimonas noertemannii]NYT68900.1 hypothetical protein [Pusillimonas noertemannii]PVY62079.1 hypothetical protein C7440_1569 [Pusillimonas noertemannii]TFL10924.1 hypothetical protein CSC72_10515 [Pusillimonas noertemannii]